MFLGWDQKCGEILRGIQPILVITSLTLGLCLAFLYLSVRRLWLLLAAGFFSWRMVLLCFERLLCPYSVGCWLYRLLGSCEALIQFCRCFQMVWIVPKFYQCKMEFLTRGGHDSKKKSQLYISEKYENHFMMKVEVHLNIHI